MSNVWYVVAVAAIAIVVLRYMAARKAGPGRGQDVRQAATPTDQDHRQDREDARRAGMSADDRTWEAASLQRDQATRERFGQAGGEPGSEADRSYPPAGASSGPERPAPLTGVVSGPGPS